MNCPLDCEHLIEARRHEKPPVKALEDFPHQEIRISEQFLRDNEELLMVLASTVLSSGLETQGAVDLDAREALESLVRTYKTLESGLIYETRPSNPYAAAIHHRVQETLEEYRKAVAERSGIHTIRDAAVLGVLVFLQRLELQENNGRPRGRAFFDFLRAHFQASQKQTAANLV